MYVKLNFTKAHITLSTSCHRPFLPCSTCLSKAKDTLIRKWKVNQTPLAKSRTPLAKSSFHKTANKITLFFFFFFLIQCSTRFCTASPQGLITTLSLASFKEERERKNRNGNRCTGTH